MTLDYPAGQLAQAFFTARTHEDPATRERAEQRAAHWSAVLAGMRSGNLTIGSRTPVDDLPAWVTPQVIRGGFVTGQAMAGGQLAPHEVALADRVGIAASRSALFAWHLGQSGQRELWHLLDTGAYRVELPEHAALLTVAWLLRAGDRAAALGLVDAISRYADQLSFAPIPGPADDRDPAAVWREPAGVVAGALKLRRENPRMAAMRETLTVWNPFADELLDLWLSTAGATGTVGEAFPAGWRDRAQGLLDRYQLLALQHQHCKRHLRRGENLTILRTALAETLAGADLAAGLTPRARGMLRHAVASMVARRGLPGSPEHRALRLAQARDAALPGFHLLARVVVARLAALDPEAGVADVDAVCAPVSAGEAETYAVPAGTRIPDPIRRTVRRAAAGPVAELVTAGVIPSAETLATLVPQIAAVVDAATYPDPASRTLMAATYRAFRRRRSLLLLDLAQQVRLTELPWVHALGAHRVDDDGSRTEAGRTLRRLGELALDGFPGTLMPNPLVRELAALGEAAGEDLPWVEELAADIFEGRFSAKYARAARVAGKLLADSLYARYYDVDYDALSPFGELCHRRADVPNPGFWVAANGMVIEQAQILTTHNLATLAGPLGVVPPDGWAALARRTFGTVVRLTGRLEHVRTVKDIAYAWRHLVCYLSLPGVGDPRSVIEQLHTELAEAPDRVRERLTPALVGLGYVAHGGRFTDGHSPGGGRRLLGWSTTPHWLLDA